MQIQFLQPLLLILLGLLPFFWWASRRLRSLERGRRWTVRVLRTVIVLCFVLALAQMQFTRRGKELTVFYVLDHSDSIPSDQRKLSYEAIQQTARRMKASDNAGLIVFGAEPSIEFSPVKKVDFSGQLQSAVPSERTNVAAALRLAMAAFPPEVMKRIVLLTDGNENEGAAIEVARLAHGNNIPVDVVGLSYKDRQDLMISKVVAPQQTALDAPFDVKIFAEARENTNAILRLYQSRQDERGEHSEALVAEQKGDLIAGKKNGFVMPRRLSQGGFHTFRATIEAPNDARPENNTATGFTYVKSRPRVLYIEGDLTGVNHLLPALRLQDIDVTMAGPEGIPQTLQDLQSFDSLILSNVPASDMSASQMQMIEQAVHSLGVGFIMVGGENSFGAGGYQDSPIEKVLPVSMDIKQKKVLPNGAMVIVLHTCEIPAGNTWAREVSVAALNVLSRQDFFGLLYYGASSTGSLGGGGWGEYWAWEPGLQQTGDKRRMRSIIRGVQPSDMPTFDPTLEMAYKELKRVKTQAKHIVVISDGDPAPPNQRLANNIRDEGISISTVAIAPHDPSSADNLRALAYWGGGNFYYPKSSTELPRIFVKEATIVRRSLISEQAFKPEVTQYSEALTGIDGGYPTLRGHVVTTPKGELATLALATTTKVSPDSSETEVEPVLAHWRYGLGKTVAFTSDAKNKWAADWVSWGNFAKFWAQVVRWSMRETSSANYQIQTDISNGRGTVIIDALDDAGNFENFLDFDGNVVVQSADRVEGKPLSVRQVAPGRYEATFPATEVGTYMVSLTTKKGDQVQVLTGGAALSYSPEYQVSRSNDALIERIASESGGQLVQKLDEYNPFVHNLPSGGRPTPLWPLFAWIGLVLIPVDIFMRRVFVDWGAVWGWTAAKSSAILGSLRPARTEADETMRMSALKDAKARATRPAEDEAEGGGEAAGTGAQTGAVGAKAAKAPAKGKPSPKSAAPAGAAAAPDAGGGRDLHAWRERQAQARAALREKLDHAAQQLPEGSPSGDGVFGAPPPPPGAGPVRHRGKETFAPSESGARDRSQAPPGEGEGGFTGSLLEAKRRAKKKTR